MYLKKKAPRKIVKFDAVEKAKGKETSGGFGQFGRYQVVSLCWIPYCKFYSNVKDYDTLL